MKKLLTRIVLAALISSFSPAISHAGLLGGGMSGPMPVYNVDKTVDAATLATQVNTMKQLEAALANLATMDPATAAANAQYIQEMIQQLINMQNQMQGLVMDYSNFQESWNQQYPEFSDYKGMSAEEYAQSAQKLLDDFNTRSYYTMESQGIISNNAGTAGMLKKLMEDSQSAEGALAAAQIGHQIAALQIQQMMQFQQMMAQSQREQSQWLAYQAHKEKMSREIEAQIWGVEE